MGLGFSIGLRCSSGCRGCRVYRVWGRVSGLGCKVSGKLAVIIAGGNMSSILFGDTMVPTIE